MDLMHNPLADLHGPGFLVVYSIAVLMVLGIVWYLAKSNEWVTGVPPERIPLNPDPLQIAYLRGGSSEVARTAIVDLHARGLLELDGSIEGVTRVRQTDGASPDAVARLDPLERAAYGYFENGGKTVAVAFRDPAFRAAIEQRCEKWREEFENRKLITTAAMRRSAPIVGIVGVMVIGAMGAYKALVALDRGRTNIGYLIIIGVVGIVMSAVLGRIGRLTTAGRRYISQLQDAFGAVRERAVSPQPTSGYSPDLPLGVGLFGTALLAGTAYSYLAPELRPVQAAQSSQAAGSSGGCGGSSCSGWDSGGSSGSADSSSSSSGGDGGGGGGDGGGGGCGGGGCGGCGGGGD